MPSVHVAGQSGASGLLLHEMLERRADLRLLSGGGRANAELEAELLEAADVVILCLPPAAATATLARIVNPAVRVIDNSAAHRVADGWVYGLPELGSHQRAAIRQARRVSAPGCYATGFILALRPLIHAGLVNPAAPICAQGIGGYSAGGKRLIARFEQAAPSRPDLHRGDRRKPGKGFFSCLPSYASRV
jgi:N-acetyl-gamma-glutamyl-phosphate reductase